MPLKPADPAHLQAVHAALAYDIDQVGVGLCPDYYVPMSETARTRIGKDRGWGVAGACLSMFLTRVALGTAPPDAAASININWCSLRTLISHNPRLQKKFEEAFESGLDLCESKIKNRGIDGWDETTTTITENSDGTETKTIKTTNKFSDSLALAYMKRHRKSWREHSNIDIIPHKTVEDLTDEELDEKIKAYINSLPSP